MPQPQQLQQQQQPDEQLQQQPEQEQQELPVQEPYIGWSLVLHPRQLDDCYWRERAVKHLQWDFQVVLFLSVTLLALTLRFLHHMGVTRVTLSFGAAWLMCITWGVALFFPALYIPHRIQIVVVGRVMMAISAYLATNGVHEQLYKTLMFPSPTLSLFLKMFLFCNTGQMPVESVRLQLPLLWQMLGTGGKAVALFVSEFTNEFVGFCHRPIYLNALDGMNGFWALIVQSGAPMPLPVSSRLAGRADKAVMAVTTLWVTVVWLIGYLSYMSLWSDMRVWLASKAQSASPPTTDSRSSSGSGIVVVDGVAVTQDQLREMCQTPLGVLLNTRGVVGTTSKVLLHAGVINTICMLSWVLSHCLARQVLPGLLPDRMLDVYYPLLPTDMLAAAAASAGSGSGECAAGEACVLASQ